MWWSEFISALCADDFCFILIFHLKAFQTNPAIQQGEVWKKTTTLNSYQNQLSNCICKPEKEAKRKMSNSIMIVLLSNKDKESWNYCEEFLLLIYSGGQLQYCSRKSLRSKCFPKCWQYSHKIKNDCFIGFWVHCTKVWAIASARALGLNNACFLVPPARNIIKY